MMRLLLDRFRPDATVYLPGATGEVLPLRAALADDPVRMRRVRVVTHDPRALAATSRFHAIDSAREVDLFGQANLERRGERLAGGCGGAIDFARASAMSETGRSIVALPATTVSDAVPRIVAQLTTPTIALGRAEIDAVVTEYGVADLRGRSLDARAEGLIVIAGQDARGDLERGWKGVRDAR